MTSIGKENFFGWFLLFRKLEYFYSEELSLEVWTRSNCRRILCFFSVISDIDVLTISLSRPSCFLSEVSSVSESFLVYMFTYPASSARQHILRPRFFCFMVLYCSRVLLLLSPKFLTTSAVQYSFLVINSSK